MFVPIEKWHGCKNDFIVTWMTSTDKDTVLESLKRQAKSLCSRDGSGIGADGILVIEVTTRKDILPKALHIINSDGTIAMNCGNGLRCAAMSVRRKHFKDRDDELDGVSFMVEGQTIDCRFVGNVHRPIVAVTMPIPQVDEDNQWHKSVLALFDKTKSSHSKLNSELHTVSLGNSHLVAIVPEASKDLAQAFGPAMQAARDGDGINLHIAESLEVTEKDLKQAKADLGEPIGELYKVWPWERGVGLTQACGTGACAVAVSAYESGMIERSSWIVVDMPGGRLYVKQSEPGDPVILAGPATFVFSGDVEI